MQCSIQYIYIYSTVQYKRVNILHTIQCPILYQGSSVDRKVEQFVKQSTLNQSTVENRVGIYSGHVSSLSDNTQIELARRCTALHNSTTQCVRARTTNRGLRSTDSSLLRGRITQHRRELYTALHCQYSGLHCTANTMHCTALPIQCTAMHRDCTGTALALH